MKLPDSTPMESGSFLTIREPWRTEWEIGVQVRCHKKHIRLLYSVPVVFDLTCEKLSQFAIHGVGNSLKGSVASCFGSFSVSRNFLSLLVHCQS